MSKQTIQITDRDMEILRLIHKFRFCLGRHIKALSGFNGLRSTDRRLKALVDSGYLTRKKYMYGIPYLYTLTYKGKILIGENKRIEKIRIDRIPHDISVLETVIFYIKKYRLTINEIISEKDLQSKAGFGTRKHCPDFLVIMQNQKHAIEIELNPKTKERLKKNISENYMNYDLQVWFTDNNKVYTMIEEYKKQFPNLHIVRLEGVKTYVASYME